MAKRRERGDGAVYQRPDGMWCAVLDLGYVDGKRRRKWLYGKTRKEVVEKLREAQRQQGQGVDLRAEQTTVAEFLQHWLTNVVAQRNKERTQESYGETVRRHISPAIGHHRLDTLRPEHVQIMINASQAKDLHRTAQYARTLLVRAINQAVKWRLVSYNVAALTAIDPRNLLRRFKRALERAKLPATIRFHDLRHSCATFLIAQGEHPRVVMEILGHAQMSTTMDIYGHVLPSTQRAAATKLDALLGEATDSDQQAGQDQRDQPNKDEDE